MSKRPDWLRQVVDNVEVESLFSESHESSKEPSEDLLEELRCRDRVRELACAERLAQADAWWVELCEHAQEVIESGDGGTPPVWARTAVEACPQGRASWFAVYGAFGSCLAYYLDDMDMYVHEAKRMIKGKRVRVKELDEYYYGKHGHKRSNKRRLRMAHRCLTMALELVPSLLYAMGDSAAEHRTLFFGAGALNKLDDPQDLLQLVHQFEDFSRGVRLAVAWEQRVFEKEVDQLVVQQLVDEES